jgi:predicted RND superfamily exporter protein
MFPLSLTALSTLTGFLSLSIINGSGHLQLGVIIAVAVVITWGGVFFWLDLGDYEHQTRPMLPRFQRAQGKLFAKVARYRYVSFIIVLAAMVWGGFQLTNLSIEPYPIKQLPESTTIKKADRRINQEFYGTLPFFIEIDTGEKLGVLKKETVLEMDRIHKDLAKGNTGYAFSLLSVLKRMNFYFMGSEDSLLTSNEFDDFYDALIEQYLLYYSSSVDPLEYESLLDNSYRLFSIKGLVFYRDYRDLEAFTSQVEKIKTELPAGWTLSLHGMVDELVQEQNNLKNNWVLSFLGGSFLIFVTVLVFYRRFFLALLSLFPGVISMVISFGVIALLGISIDAFSIIFVAIITGLVIDYSIHTLVALDQIKEVTSLEEGFSAVVGYSGIPLFLSFMTSLLSFSVLFLSSFRGARNLGLLLITSLVLSFFLSLYLLPLIVLPFRLKKGVKNA